MLTSFGVLTTTPPPPPLTVPLSAMEIDPSPLSCTVTPAPLCDVTLWAVTLTSPVPLVVMSTTWASVPLPVTVRLYALTVTLPTSSPASTAMPEPPVLFDPVTFRSPNLTDTSPAPVFWTRMPSCAMAPMAVAEIVTSAPAPALAWIPTPDGASTLPSAFIVTSPDPLETAKMPPVTPRARPDVVIEMPAVELETTSTARPCAVIAPATETVTASPLASLRTRMPASSAPPDEVTVPVTSMLTAPPPVFRATIPAPPGDVISPPFADCVSTMPPAPDWTRVSASFAAADTVESFSLKSSFVPAATDGARAPRSPLHSKMPLPMNVSSHVPGIESCRSNIEKPFCRIEKKLALSPATTNSGEADELSTLNTSTSLPRPSAITLTSMTSRFGFRRPVSLSDCRWLKSASTTSTAPEALLRLFAEIIDISPSPERSSVPPFRLIVPPKL